MEVLSVVVRTITMLAVAGAGVYSAFAAHRASPRRMWLVAFLILVIGIIPFGINQMLLPRSGNTVLALLVIAWSVYFVGAFLIIAGRLMARSARALICNLVGSAGFVAALVLFGVVADWRVWSVSQIAVRLLLLVLIVGVSAGAAISVKKYRRRER